jgi:hypothetical protein
MRVELKWLEGARKTPVPVNYACTITFDTGLAKQLYSIILHFPQAVRTYAELELLVIKDLVIPDGVFYITEGGRVVAEAQKYE